MKSQRFCSMSYWTTRKLSFRDTRRLSKKSQILSKKINREKRKQSKRIRSTSSLSGREERSFCLFIMQGMAAKTENNGSYSMKVHQKHAFGQENQGSEQSGDCAWDRANCSWSMTAAEWQKQTSIKRLRKHIRKIPNNQINLRSRAARTMQEQISKITMLLPKIKAILKQCKLTEVQVM